MYMSMASRGMTGHLHGIYSRLLQQRQVHIKQQWSTEDLNTVAPRSDEGRSRSRP